MTCNFWCYKFWIYTCKLINSWYACQVAVFFQTIEEQHVFCNTKFCFVKWLHFFHVLFCHMKITHCGINSTEISVCLFYVQMSPLTVLPQILAYMSATFTPSSSVPRKWGWSPLWYSYTTSIFLLTNLKNFLKAPRGSARRKNAIFWPKFFKKCLKTLFILFFKKFACDAENAWQNSVRIVLSESSEN